MAPKLKGSVRPKGDAWEASLPVRRGSKERVYARFPTEDECWAWCRMGVADLDAGRSPRAQTANGALRLPTASSVRLGPDFETVANAWIQLRYTDNHQAEGAREMDLRRYLRLHLLPYFAGPMPLVGEPTPADAGEITTIDWVRTRAGYPATDPASPLTPDPTGLEPSYVTEILWMHRQVIGHARSLGHDVQDTIGDVRAMKRRGSDAKPAGKRAAALVDYETCRELAANLHVIHQTVFWLMRVLGLRISEAYGLRVGSVVDFGTYGLLQVEGQGGRPFYVRTEDETIEAVNRVDTVKTSAGYRMIVVPQPLMVLIRTVVEAYHADADGDVDPVARLIPTINAAEGGQVGFRNALKRAAKAVQVDASERNLTAHDLRKALCTDLGWDPLVSELLQRRIVGHRAGRDVYAAVYLLDSREVEDLMPAAKSIEAEIASTIGSLMVPTAVRPTYGKKAYAGRRHHIDAVLVDAGLHIVDRDRLGAAEASVLLGVSPQTTRALMRTGRIPAVKIGTEWRAQVDDVASYADRWSGYTTLPEVAQAAGVTYHRAYTVLDRLKLEPLRADGGDTLLLTEAEAAAIIGEFDRVRALSARSTRVAEACQVLNAATSTVNRWIDTGALVLDSESDGTGAKYVTRASVQAQLDRRGGRISVPSISLNEFTDVSGLDAGAVAALVKKGLLVWAGRPRAQHLSRASVEAWCIGYRPDLVDAWPTRETDIG